MYIHTISCVQRFLLDLEAISACLSIQSSSIGVPIKCVMLSSTLSIVWFSCEVSIKVRYKTWTLDCTMDWIMDPILDS